MVRVGWFIDVDEHDGETAIDFATKAAEIQMVQTAHLERLTGCFEVILEDGTVKHVDLEDGSAWTGEPTPWPSSPERPSPKELHHALDALTLTPSERRFLTMMSGFAMASFMSAAGKLLGEQDFNHNRTTVDPEGSDLPGYPETAELTVNGRRIKITMEYVLAPEGGVTDGADARAAG